MGKPRIQESPDESQLDRFFRIFRAKLYYGEIRILLNQLSELIYQQAVSQNARA
jgi:hypothetical protein